MPIAINQLIEASDNSGIFDRLSADILAKLVVEYRAGRINGKEYSNVYLGSLQTVLQQSVSFLIQQEQTNANIALIEAQTALAEQERLNAVKQGLILDAQLTSIGLDNQIKGEQLLGEGFKNLQTQAQTTLLGAQKLRTDAETSLVNQKIKTEEAQIKDQVDGVDVAGIIGKQAELYNEQANGFKRDAEQKSLKLVSDLWSTARSTAADPDAVTMPTYANQESLQLFINKLAQGISVTLPSS